MKSNNLFKFIFQVTISTQIETRPNGFVGQNSNNGARLERTGENSCRIMPKLEIISKLSGGGCVVQSDCPYSEPLHEPLLDAKQLRQRLEKAAEYQRTQFKTARLVYLTILIIFQNFHELNSNKLSHD